MKLHLIISREVDRGQYKHKVDTFLAPEDRDFWADHMFENFNRDVAKLDVDLPGLKSLQDLFPVREEKGSIEKTTLLSSPLVNADKPRQKGNHFPDICSDCADLACEVGITSKGCPKHRHE